MRKYPIFPLLSSSNPVVKSMYINICKRSCWFLNPSVMVVNYFKNWLILKLSSKTIAVLTGYDYRSCSLWNLKFLSKFVKLSSFFLDVKNFDRSTSRASPSVFKLSMKSSMWCLRPKLVPPFLLNFLNVCVFCILGNLTTLWTI